MENINILVAQPSMPRFEEFVEEIRPIWESCMLTNMGSMYEKLLYQLMEYLDVPRLSLFVNGHMALELAIEALGLTGEVITTPYTFASTTHAIARSGLTPVFCDIRPDDYTIDATKIEALITEKTSAIIPVHVYGNLCDVEAIDAIAEKHGLKVLYDAAQAFGMRYKGEGVGNFGDAVMFSFHATKVFHTIEGGAIAFSEEALSKPLHDMKNFGIAGEGKVESIGANGKLDEFRAAMGICNLRHVEGEIDKRRAVYERYLQHLDGVPGLRPNRFRQGIQPNYAYFPLYIEPEAFGRHRDDVFRALKKHHILSRKYFYPATNRFVCYRNRFHPGCTPVSDQVSNNILTLPMYADLPLVEVDRICRIILDCAEA
ncbi:MAG: DegT/DnrJ/EryC1/StrS family aminotransferase [Neisseria sp.]|uniref:DegT/DnrJ/EryC1/StrS family aminotransferase n=1 Tax=Neisseria sp. TaxID=192066 RepID=UPI0026DD306F|nr:DegT/DnrJ/EryC1/StrS family aminotransferase [Neisseria sp.]MDO4640955.1 DegT/DnrJ/EryC1/StrS family aminotransferase [Neisseria sp.]